MVWRWHDVVRREGDEGEEQGGCFLMCCAVIIYIEHTIEIEHCYYTDYSLNSINI